MMWPLIHRVKAGEASNDLAGDIASELAGPLPYIRQDDPWQWDAWHKAEHHLRRAFRGDIDAVLALLPHGWTWGMQASWREDIPLLPDNWSWNIPCDTDDPRARCSAWVAKDGVIHGEVEGLSGPALALLSALLEGVARDRGITG